MAQPPKKPPTVAMATTTWPPFLSSSLRPLIGLIDLLCLRFDFLVVCLHIFPGRCYCCCCCCCCLAAYFFVFFFFFFCCFFCFVFFGRTWRNAVAAVGPCVKAVHSSMAGDLLLFFFVFFVFSFVLFLFVRSFRCAPPFSLFVGLFVCFVSFRRQAFPINFVSKRSPTTSFSFFFFFLFKNSSFFFLNKGRQKRRQLQS